MVIPMGDDSENEPLEVKLARVEKDVAWLKNLYHSLDVKTWGILIAIVINIFVEILLRGLL